MWHRGGGEEEGSVSVAQGWAEKEGSVSVAQGWGGGGG